ncbi:aminotransferase-like domain-containing protein [Mycolicibacterium mageritense]|uniref:aminotransferase-like domain-containing protein n=2 Tax=Mycolicibacterium mageritense TaxID=53462 RepID=UPI001E5387D6|nr:PLP-dependent aminotransferase family protein [Mycolicibacterium mageritense]
MRSSSESSPGFVPTVRTLQRQHRVSPATVQAVTRELAAAGLVEVRPGAGTFVAQRRIERSRDVGWQHLALGGPPPDAAVRALDLVSDPPTDTIRLSGGYLDEPIMPIRALSASFERAARRPGAWGRPPVDGDVALREWFARAIGGVAHDEVLITNGGQSALSIAIRTLTSPGQPILIESPGYLAAISIARTHGLQIVPVPVDEHGLRTDLLDDALLRTGARVVVVQPLFANPTGTTLSAARRAELFDALERHSAFAIEDDVARHLSIDGPTPPTLMSEDKSGNIIHICSLTKGITPGMRVGALCAHGPVYLRLRAAKTLDDLCVAGPVQAAALDFLTSTAYPRHLRTIARELGRRRDTLIRELAARLPNTQPVCIPRGGMHLWTRLPAGADPDAVGARALAAGVLVSSGVPWYPAEPDGPHLRLSYGCSDIEHITEGVRRLASVV